MLTSVFTEHLIQYPAYKTYFLSLENQIIIVSQILKSSQDKSSCLKSNIAMEYYLSHDHGFNVLMQHTPRYSTNLAKHGSNMT